MQNTLVTCSRNPATGCLEIVDSTPCAAGQVCRGPIPEAACGCVASNVGAPCGTCGGVVQCDGSCSKNPQPEMCNGVDDDCNGQVDNGFRTRIVPTSFPALMTKRAGCEAVAGGRECDVAAHRTCKDMGCVVSGVLSQSAATAVPELICVMGEIKNLAFSTLKAHFAPCDGVTLHEGFQCLVATHRYCERNGFGAGFGPIEWQSVGAEGVVQGVCLPKSMAATRSTSLMLLTSLEPGCQYATIPKAYDVKAACNTAANRYCRQMGFDGGYGPVEASGDVAVVVCLSK